MPTIMKDTKPLYKSLFSSAPYTSPPEYSSHFCKYISSNISITSSEIFPDDFRVLSHLTASIMAMKEETDLVVKIAVMCSGETNYD